MVKKKLNESEENLRMIRRKRDFEERYNPAEDDIFYDKYRDDEDTFNDEELAFWLDDEIEEPEELSEDYDSSRGPRFEKLLDEINKIARTHRYGEKVEPEELSEENYNFLKELALDGYIAKIQKKLDKVTALSDTKRADRTDFMNQMRAKYSRQTESYSRRRKRLTEAIDYPFIKELEAELTADLQSLVGQVYSVNSDVTIDEISAELKQNAFTARLDNYTSRINLGFSDNKRVILNREKLEAIINDKPATMPGFQEFLHSATDVVKDKFSEFLNRLEEGIPASEQARNAAFEQRREKLRHDGKKLAQDYYYDQANNQKEIKVMRDYITHRRPTRDDIINADHPELPSYRSYTDFVNGYAEEWSELKAQKRSQVMRDLHIRYRAEGLKACKDAATELLHEDDLKWLQNNIQSIEFGIPDPDDSTIGGDERAIEHRRNMLDRFEAANREVFNDDTAPLRYKLTSGDLGDSNWGIIGEVIFKVPVSDAPTNVLALITRCKEEAGFKSEIPPRSPRVKSGYFGETVLDALRSHNMEINFDEPATETNEGFENIKFADPNRTRRGSADDIKQIFGELLPNTRDISDLAALKSGYAVFCNDRDKAYVIFKYKDDFEVFVLSNDLKESELYDLDSLDEAWKFVLSKNRNGLFKSVDFETMQYIFGALH